MASVLAALLQEWNVLRSLPGFMARWWLVGNWSSSLRSSGREDCSEILCLHGGQRLPSKQFFHDIHKLGLTSEPLLKVKLLASLL